MTVAAQTPQEIYLGNGSTTAFPVPFRYNAPTDLRAIRRAADGSEVVLFYGIDYTATSGETDAGGTLTVSVAVPSGSKLVVTRRTARIQPTDYITAGAFTAESHEAALDRAMLVAQELEREQDRAVKVPVGESGLTLPALAQRAGNFLRFDNFGNPLTISTTELGTLIDPARQVGTSEAFSQTFGPRSQVVVLHEPGVADGGYYIEFAPAENVTFGRVYARVFLGTGTCDIRIFGGGVIWQREAVGPTPVDVAETVILLAGYDLVVAIENIVGTVQGVVVFLEE